MNGALLQDDSSTRLQLSSEVDCGLGISIARVRLHRDAKSLEFLKAFGGVNCSWATLLCVLAVHGSVWCLFVTCVMRREVS